MAAATMQSIYTGWMDSKLKEPDLENFAKTDRQLLEELIAKMDRLHERLDRAEPLLHLAERWSGLRWRNKS